MINREAEVRSVCLDAFSIPICIQCLACCLPLDGVRRRVEYFLFFASKSELSLEKHMRVCSCTSLRLSIDLTRRGATERKVNARQPKHANREDNDRFRNYSCACRRSQRGPATNRSRRRTLARRWFGPTTFSSLSSMNERTHARTIETKAVHLLVRLTRRSNNAKQEEDKSFYLNTINWSANLFSVVPIAEQHTERDVHLLLIIFHSFWDRCDTASVINAHNRRSMSLSTRSHLFFLQDTRRGCVRKRMAFSLLSFFFLPVNHIFLLLDLIISVNTVPVVAGRWRVTHRSVKRLQMMGCLWRRSFTSERWRIHIAITIGTVCRGEVSSSNSIPVIRSICVGE